MLIGNKKSANGFTFIGLLIIISIMGLTLAEAGTLWSDLRKREQEQELLRVGDKIRLALGEYYNQSPGMVKQFPMQLDDLLNDTRFPTRQRYLRKIYQDPLTGQPNWGTLEAPSGGIMGVYSLAPGGPMKIKGFREIYKSFEKRTEYSQWIFAYLPETAESINQ